MKIEEEIPLSNRQKSSLIKHPPPLEDEEESEEEDEEEQEDEESKSKEGKEEEEVKEEYDYILSILKRFEFDSKLMRGSVLVMSPDEQVHAFVKGAPDVMKDLCKEVPAEFDSIAEEKSKKGFRVIAMAYKAMPDINEKSAQGVTRAETERDLEFLGLLVMENKIKAETADAIQELVDGDVRCIMATGDGIDTAMSVARTIKLIDEDKQTWVAELDETDEGSP